MPKWNKISLAFATGLVIAVSAINGSNNGISAAQESSKQEKQVDQPAEKPDSEASAETVGIVAERPDEKPFVELPNGKFMVPYTATIPGTDVEFTMVPIPAGKFKMGSPDDEEDRRDDEGPQFEVTVEPFWMGKYEVTWAEYKRYMKLDKYFKALHGKGLRVVTDDNEIDGITAPSSLYDPSFTFEAGQDANQPAASMTQFAAKQYTKWLSLTSGAFYRLPMESEWEYACRAGTTTAYYFGDDPDDLEDHAWYIDNSDEERHAVGELSPNPFGLYDMHGNCAEWVLDQYSEEGYTHVKGNSVTTKEAFAKPTTLYPRAVRGGSWELEREECRSASRLPSHDKDWRSEDPNFPKSPWWFTDSPALGVGFRLLRPLNEPETRASKEEFWAADIEDIADDARNRIKENGRGAYGIADPGLPKDIDELTDEDR